MKFEEAEETLKQASKHLADIWKDAYCQAKKQVGGNWQEPEVMKRRREFAIKVADKLLQDKKLTVTWGTISK